MIIGSPGCLYLCCSSSSSPLEKKECVWDEIGEVCLFAGKTDPESVFGKKETLKQWDSGARSGATWLQAAVCVESGPCFQPWRKWAIWGRWYTMPQLFQSHWKQWRDFIFRLKNKYSQREAVLNKPCGGISDKNKAVVWGSRCFTYLDIFHVTVTTLAGALQSWHPRCVKCRPVCVPKGKQRHSSGWMSLLLSPAPSHPYARAFSRVFWTTEQIVGRFIGGNSETAGRPSQGQTDVQVTWKRKRKDRGREVGNRGMIEAAKNKLKHQCTVKKAQTSLTILCQCRRWAKYFPLSLGLGSSFVFYSILIHPLVCLLLV